MLRLFVQAPFAAFRTFTAGWYRPTAPFLTPSAAYGLALNLAGIETRRDDGLSAMTVTAFGLPPTRIALGAVPGPGGDFPTIHTLYQQLHNYPVGASGKERKEGAKGSKYNITPVRRELLADLLACVCLDGNADLEARVRDGLARGARGPGRRYGLPFAGDNAFLLDRLEVRDGPTPARWYRRLGADDEPGIIPHLARLTVWIDRQDLSKTESALYVPDGEASDGPPSDDAYWTAIRPPESPPSTGRAPKRRGKS